MCIFTGVFSNDKIITSSEKGFRKLSSDLRLAVKNDFRDPVIISILTRDEVDVDKWMTRSVKSRKIGRFQWINGETTPDRLAKIASHSNVVSIISTETFKPVKDIAHAGDGKDFPEISTIQTRNVHFADEAWKRGYQGEGVTVGVVDTGVDFSHPDLQGSQALVSSGPYEGWPFCYDTLSGYNWALNRLSITPVNYWDHYLGTGYCGTLPIEDVNYADGFCTGSITVKARLTYFNLTFDVDLEMTWPDTSKSGNYRYGVHPDYYLFVLPWILGMNYSSSYVPPVFILSDENIAGVYDTVYVDCNFDRDFRDETALSKENQTGGHDIWDAAGNPDPDGINDFSTGLLTWISDGVNSPPGVKAIFPDNAHIPSQGELVCFLYDGDNHGTRVAGCVAARGVITDPAGLGGINTKFAGGFEAGGAGGPVITGMAPGSHIAGFQNGFRLPFDSWTLCTLGFDGIPESGDEVNIINNSWGSSTVIEDGWDNMSRFANYLNLEFAPEVTFLASTGNGGPGYGTTTRPSGGSIIDVGASTSYGTISSFGLVDVDQFTWNSMAPFSGRGPGTTGDISPDVVAVGSEGFASYPLNQLYYNLPDGSTAAIGQASYWSFAGTSMSCPVSAGILALGYQAYKESNGSFPDWNHARRMLLEGCLDIGLDPATQGSGSLDALHSIEIAKGETFHVSPSQWKAGDYSGKEYSAFPSILHAGETAEKTFTIVNPTSETMNVNSEAYCNSIVYEDIRDITIPSSGTHSFLLPDYLIDITEQINQYEPDMLIVQTRFPYSDFDSDDNLVSDQRCRTVLYDWIDLNQNGKLWTDENENGLIEWDEIDVTNDGSLVEINWMAYGSVDGNQTGLLSGSESLSRRHDGIFLGFQMIRGDRDIAASVRIAFYKRTKWDWINPETSSLQAGADSTLQTDVSLTIPANVKPGYYQGFLKFSDQARVVNVPVSVNVAAGSSKFDFGSTAFDDQPSSGPYHNGSISGYFDWQWRYEAGDWRLYCFDLPPGTASPKRKLIVDTEWENVPTDVDTWILSPAADEFSAENPEYFGPYGLKTSTGSLDTHIGNGTFTFQTATGSNREIITYTPEDGLNMIVLHNILFAGKSFSESLSGRVFPVEVDPPFFIGTGENGAWNQSFTSGDDIPEGLVVNGYGLSPKYEYGTQYISQDGPNPCLSDWIEKITINNAFQLEVRTSSTIDMDIDLYIYRDDGDGNLTCTNGDEKLAESLTPTSEEMAYILNPDDGTYWIIVHGYDVPGEKQPFTIDISVPQGNDLTLGSIPDGPVSASNEITFPVSWSVEKPGRYEGIVTIGIPQAPYILRVPVEVWIPSSTGWSLY